MTGPTNQPTPADMGAWMRRMEKTLMHEQRRPRITKASDILGPGFGPYAVPVTDWNGAMVRFNGFFYGAAGTGNSPDAGVDFLGLTIGTADGHVSQMLTSHRDGDVGGERVYVRSLHLHPNQVPVYTPWSLVSGTPVGAIIEFAGTVIPPNYLLCDGAVYSSAAYPELAAQRASVGSITFTVPNLPGSAPGVQKIIRA